MMVSEQARAEPMRIDWAWVSVPKYRRVMLAVGLYKRAISAIEATAPATETTRSTRIPRTKDRLRVITASTTRGQTR